MSSSTQGLKNSREQFSWFNSGSRKYEGVVQLVQLRDWKIRGSSLVGSTQGLKHTREQFSWFNSGSRKYEGMVQLVQLREQKILGSSLFGSTQGLKHTREQFSWFNPGSRKYEGMVQLVQLREQKTRGSRKFLRVCSSIFQETQSLYNTNLRAVSFLFAHSEIINPSFIRFVYTIGLMYCTLFIQIYTTQVRMQEGRKVGRQEGRKVGRQEGRKVRR